MRKFAKVCICGVAAAMLLTGCSKKAATDGTTAAAETTAEATTAETTAPEGTTAGAGVVEGLTTGAEADNVTLGEYKGVPVTKMPAQEVADEEVDTRIQAVLNSHAVTDVPADHVAQNGDTVNIDYVGKKDGVAFDGGTAEGYNLQLGSGSFIPGFEDGLVGVKAGDKKELNLTFPETYGNADLAGADVVFEVTVNSFTSIIPELNDEFVLANSTTAKNVDEYKAEVKDQLLKEKEESAKMQQKSEIFMNVVADSQVDVMDKTVEEEYNRQLLSYTNQAQSYGMTIENMAAMYGMDMPTFQAQLKQIAAEMVRQKLIINAIAEKEGITLTDAEREEIAGDLGFGSLAAMESIYGEETTESFLLTEKVASFLLDNAVEK